MPAAAWWSYFRKCQPGNKGCQPIFGGLSQNSERESMWQAHPQCLLQPGALLGAFATTSWNRCVLKARQQNILHDTCQVDARGEWPPLCSQERMPTRRDLRAEVLKGLKYSHQTQPALDLSPSPSSEVSNHQTHLSGEEGRPHGWSDRYQDYTVGEAQVFLTLSSALQAVQECSRKY